MEIFDSTTKLLVALMALLAREIRFHLPPGVRTQRMSSRLNHPHHLKS
jgi:hypothetical protein